MDMQASSLANPISLEEPVSLGNFISQWIKTGQDANCNEKLANININIDDVALKILQPIVEQLIDREEYIGSLYDTLSTALIAQVERLETNLTQFYDKLSDSLLSMYSTLYSQLVDKGVIPYTPVIPTREQDDTSPGISNETYSQTNQEEQSSIQEDATNQETTIHSGEDNQSSPIDNLLTTIREELANGNDASEQQQWYIVPSRCLNSIVNFETISGPNLPVSLSQSAIGPFGNREFTDKIANTFNYIASNDNELFNSMYTNPNGLLSIINKRYVTSNNNNIAGTTHQLTTVSSESTIAGEGTGQGQGQGQGQVECNTIVPDVNITNVIESEDDTELPMTKVEKEPDSVIDGIKEYLLFMGYKPKQYNIYAGLAETMEDKVNKFYNKPSKSILSSSDERDE